MSGVEGGRPSSFSGGFKGGILFEKRIPPLVLRRASRSPSRASAGKRMQRCRAAIESPAPYGRKKGAALSGCINSPRPLGAKKAALARGNKKRSLFRGSFSDGISHYIRRNYRRNPRDWSSSRCRHCRTRRCRNRRCHYSCCRCSGRNCSFPPIRAQRQR